MVNDLSSQEGQEVSQEGFLHRILRQVWIPAKRKSVSEKIGGELIVSGKHFLLDLGRRASFGQRLRAVFMPRLRLEGFAQA